MVCAPAACPSNPAQDVPWVREPFARAACPGLRTHTTPLLASHPLVTSVLCDRVAAADAAPPTHPAGEGAAGASTLRT